MPAVANLHQRAPAAGPRRAHWRHWAGLLLAVTVGHALLISQWGLPPPPAGHPPLALTARSIRSDLPPAGVAPSAQTAVARVAVQRPLATAPAAAGPAAAAAEPGSAPAPPPGSAPASAQPQSGLAVAMPSALSGAGAAAGNGADSLTPAEPPPLYPTRLPPGIVLSYALDRDSQSGSAELRWQPDGPGYSLRLAGGASTAGGFELASRGLIDPAGVAPERFTDRRRRGGVLAVNFQRDSGRITFSRPALEWPLPAGAQDRLSWMVQLPAVVAADPARFIAGTQVQMFVVGAQGDAELWSFGVVGTEALDLPAGRVDAALLLRREPRRPYDQRVEVWLDPARHHLPVQLRLTPLPGGRAMDLQLRAATAID